MPQFRTPTPFRTPAPFRTPVRFRRPAPIGIVGIARARGPATLMPAALMPDARRPVPHGPGPRGSTLPDPRRGTARS